MQQYKFNLKLLTQIFMTFLKIGPLTFGGGYSMIPLIEREIVEKRKWVKTKEISDILAVAGSVPGGIAVNAATFVGYRLVGVSGAVAAMLGVMLPTFCFVVLLSIFFLEVQGNPKMEAAFVSIRVTIVALITYAAIKIGKTAAFDKTTMALTAITVGVLYFVHIHPIVLILGGGITGIVIIHVKKKAGMQIKFEKEGQSSYRYADYYIGDGI